MIVGLSSQIKTLDPQKITSFEERLLIDQIYNGIFEYDPNNKIIPVLATSMPQFFKDHQYIIQLKQGIYFHDGRELDADSIHFTLNRLRNINADLPICDLFDGILNIKSLDKYNLLFTMKDTSYPIEYLLTRYEMYPLSKSSVEHYGDYYGQVISIGTGPYRLIEWIKDSEIILEKNSNYWNSPYPHIYNLTFKYKKESMLKDLRLGRVHMLVNITYQEANQLDSFKSINLMHHPGNCVGQIYFNITQEPFNNRKFRRAVALSINKREIIDKVFYGYATPATSCLPSWISDSDVNVSPVEYDPNMAKNLIKEILDEKIFFTNKGFLPEIESSPAFDLMYTTDNDFFYKIAIIIKQQLSEVGIAVKLIPLGKKELFDFVYGRDNHDRSLFQAALEDWKDWKGMGDADQFITGLYYSSSGENKVGLNDQKLDELINKASNTLDIKIRLALFKDAAKIVDEITPSAYLYFLDEIIAHKAYVKNIQWNNLGQISFKKIYIQR